MNIVGGVLYSYVKYRDSILDRRKKDYLKSKESHDQYSSCDMNQNNKSSTSLIESGASDDYCDTARPISIATSTLVNEKVTLS